MNRHDDEWDEDGIEDEEAIALRAVEAWLDVEGDDELAQASREALPASLGPSGSAPRHASVPRGGRPSARRGTPAWRPWSAPTLARRESGGSRLPPRPRAARRPCGGPGSGRCSRRVRCTGWRLLR